MQRRNFLASCLSFLGLSREPAHPCPCCGVPCDSLPTVLTSEYYLPHYDKESDWSILCMARGFNRAEVNQKINEIIDRPRDGLVDVKRKWVTECPDGIAWSHEYQEYWRPSGPPWYSAIAFPHAACAMIGVDQERFACQGCGKMFKFSSSEKRLCWSCLDREMTETQRLLRTFDRIAVNKGVDSAEAREFLQTHQDKKDFIQLISIELEEYAANRLIKNCQLRSRLLATELGDPYIGLLTWPIHWKTARELMTERPSVTFRHDSDC